MSDQLGETGTFNPVISFNGNTEAAYIMMSQTMTADIAFTKSTTNAYPSFVRCVRLTGDSSHAVTFTGFKKAGASLDFDNTTLNIIFFWFDGVDYWYNIMRESAGSGGGLTQLATPTGLTAGTPGITDIPFTWTAVAHASSYVLETASDAGFTTIVNTETSSTNSADAVGLTGGTTYYARVIAIGDGVTYSDSNNSATVTATTAASETILALPGGLPSDHTTAINSQNIEFISYTAATKVTTAGTLNKVKFDMIAVPTGITLFIAIWRKTGSLYDLVGSKITFTSSDLSVGINTKTNPSPFAVQVGDYVGVGLSGNTSGAQVMSAFAGANIHYTLTVPTATSSKDWDAEANIDIHGAVQLIQ